ncbi:MAG: Nif3-like dinuclear metal center hexameric protein [Taibaiella sp.]|nr:Nif3-like dinuclear metal center hexameric protein [Taibaiella sp.]
MKVKEVINILEQFAPPAYQETYDNSGLQVGNAQEIVTGILLTLDITEEVLQEAIANKCNLVIAHHPLIFSGLKRVTDNTYVERTVKMAIKHDINLYAIHTNLDNMRKGVNAMIAQKLGLTDTRILAPKQGILSKLYTYAPKNAADAVRDAMFAAGAGAIGNYNECSYNIPGTGTFRPNEDADPAIGAPGGPREWVDEVKIEVLVPKHEEKKVLQALMDSHPYEEVAYDLVVLKNHNQDIGAGMIGTLPTPMSEQDFLAHIQRTMATGCIKYTRLMGKVVEKVAICGGSGSFLLGDAIHAGADFFITSDFKYHQFFDAEGRIVIADIGHYESEQYTPQLLEAVLKKKIPNFAILLSNISTNPVKYFC